MKKSRNFGLIVSVFVVLLLITVGLDFYNSRREVLFSPLEGNVTVERFEAVSDISDLVNMSEIFFEYVIENNMSENVTVNINVDREGTGGIISGNDVSVYNDSFLILANENVSGDFSGFVDYGVNIFTLHLYDGDEHFDNYSLAFYVSPDYDVEGRVFVNDNFSEGEDVFVEYELEDFGLNVSENVSVVFDLYENIGSLGGSSDVFLERVYEERGINMSGSIVKYGSFSFFSDELFVNEDFSDYKILMTVFSEVDQVFGNDFDSGSFEVVEGDVYFNGVDEFRKAFGRITFAENLTDEAVETIENGSINLSEAIEIRRNYVKVNVSLIPFLENESATILFKEVDFYEPKVLRDGVECNNSVCDIVSYDEDEGELLLNVSGFSEYEVVEGLVCGDGTCSDEINEDCNSCEEDCGVCDEDDDDDDGDDDGDDYVPTPRPPCVSDWECNWSECVDGMQYYICRDLKSCGNVNSDAGKSQVCGEDEIIDLPGDNSSFDGKSSSSGGVGKWIWITLLVIGVIALIVAIVFLFIERDKNLKKIME